MAEPGQGETESQQPTDTEQTTEASEEAIKSPPVQTAEAGGRGRGGEERPTATAGGPAGEQPQQPQTPETTGEGDIFAGIEDKYKFPTTEEELRARVEDDLKDVLKDQPNSEEAQRIRELRGRELLNAKKFMDAVKTSARYSNPVETVREITRGIQEGRIDPISAEPYLAEAARHADRFRQKEALSHAGEWDQIIKEVKSRDGYERTKALKDIIEKINPDNALPDSLLEMIAHDEEASEQFMSKVVYKPFATPEAEYSLSFYASINFESFLTMVGNIRELGGNGRTSRERRINYAEQHEAALRLHEANKATVTQSSNIDGLMNVARTITPDRLQTGIVIDGVEQARHIFDLAFGRLYSNYDRLKPEEYQREIVGWAEKTFKEQAEKGEVKSSFKGADGQLRNLEEWELVRAFGLARDYHAAFLRVPELISWGNIPKPAEEWLKSPSAETLVRIIGGLKTLQARFRSGSTTGGPTYITLLFKDIQDKFKGKLQKIGVLDIRKDLLPLGLFSAGGFEKGWRPMGAYINTKFMKIDISRLLQTLPQVTAENTIKGKKASPRALLNTFLEEQKHGDSSAEINLGEFLIHNTGFTSQYYGQEIKVKVNGQYVDVPKELTPLDTDKSKDVMEELLLPLMGFEVKPGKERALSELRAQLEKKAKGVEKKDLLKGDYKKDVDGNYVVNEKTGQYEYEYEHFDYKPAEDQVDFSLGALMQAGGISKNIQTVLWQKIADTMPLRMAYLLSEEGVKGITVTDDRGQIRTYEETVRGEKLSNGGYRLFRENFESKLIELHLIRMRAQKDVFRTKGRHQALKLSDYFEEAGLNLEEQKFVKELQRLGREKAADLAELSFPHIPFLDDVPYKESEYLNLGPEVYARRMNDQRGYSETRDAAGEVVEHLEKPFGAIEAHLSKAKDALSGPEGSQTAQDAVYKLTKAYLIMAKQYEWARIIGVRNVAEFFNNGTSMLQKLFTTNHYSWSTRVMNVNIRDLASKALIRNEKLPGETESQMQQLLGEFEARPFNIFMSELISALGQWLLYAVFAFPSKVTEKK